MFISLYMEIENKTLKWSRRRKSGDKILRNTGDSEPRLLRLYYFYQNLLHIILNGLTDIKDFPLIFGLFE